MLAASFRIAFHTLLEVDLPFEASHAPKVTRSFGRFPLELPDFLQEVVQAEGLG